MMLIVLDKYPTIASEKLIKRAPKQFVFKQLIELGQLICSAGISSIYEPITRGKQIQKWILRNPEWVRIVFLDLLLYCKKNTKLTDESYNKLKQIYLDLESKTNHMSRYAKNRVATTAIFRYKKDYAGSNYKTNEELPIDEAINEYDKYLKWKFKKYDNNKIKTKLASKP